MHGIYSLSDRFVLSSLKLYKTDNMWLFLFQSIKNIQIKKDVEVLVCCLNEVINIDIHYFKVNEFYTHD